MIAGTVMTDPATLERTLLANEVYPSRELTPGRLLIARLVGRRFEDLLVQAGFDQPFDARLAKGRIPGGGERLADQGLATVLSQTFRALIQSRMRVGMERYAHEYPGADIVLFEPGRDDAQIFFANVFSYADRRRLAEHAYQHTRAELRRRRDELTPILARHGLALDMDVLADRDLRLIGPSIRPRLNRLAAETRRLETALDRLDHALAQGAAAPTRAR